LARPLAEAAPERTRSAKKASLARRTVARQRALARALLVPARAIWGGGRVRRPALAELRSEQAGIELGPPVRRRAVAALVCEIVVPLHTCLHIRVSLSRCFSLSLAVSMSVSLYPLLSLSLSLSRSLPLSVTPCPAADPFELALTSFSPTPPPALAQQPMQLRPETLRPYTQRPANSTKLQPQTLGPETLLPETPMKLHPEPLRPEAVPRKNR
jgi:hypothetical protein